MLQYTHYHKILRITVCVVACVLVFVSGLFATATRQLSVGTFNYAASVVGMSAGVKPTELNQITAALTERQRELDAREAALAEREIAVRLNTNTQSDTSMNYATFVLSGILFILLLLIVLNYVLDYLRMRERSVAKRVPSGT